MACCGRKNTNNLNKITPSSTKPIVKPTPEVPRIKGKNCLSCNGALQIFPQKQLLGNKLFSKFKCTKCGREYFFL